VQGLMHTPDTIISTILTTILVFIDPTQPAVTPLQGIEPRRRETIYMYIYNRSSLRYLNIKIIIIVW